MGGREEAFFGLLLLLLVVVVGEEEAAKRASERAYVTLGHTLSLFVLPVWVVFSSSDGAGW